MNRRAFLRAAGVSAGGIIVLGTAGCGLIPPLPSFGEPAPEDALAWVRLTPRGEIEFWLPRAEMGQCIDTGLSQVVAEELGCGVLDIQCRYQKTDVIAPCQLTVGSQSIENYFELTAGAASTLRRDILRRASEQSGIPVDRLELRDGMVLGPDVPVTLNSLISPGEEAILLTEQPLAKDLHSMRSKTRVVGKTVVAKHMDRIVTGTETFSRDVRLEGLLFGGVAQPPQLGARLEAYDEAAASKIDGVVGIVRGPKGAMGVVALTPMALQAGLKSLNPRWTPLTTKELENVQTLLDVDVARDAKLMDHNPISRGDVDAAARSSAQTLDLRYDSPMAAHAAMEPRAGVASYDTVTGELEVFTGSQDPWFMRQVISKATGISEAKVVVSNLRIGGAFGGRVLCQPSLEAAWLAFAVGKPVKVQWSREDDFRHNYVGPQFSTRIRASLDEKGSIVAWHHQMVGAPILTSSMLVPSYLHWAANIPADPGTVRGLETPYAFPNHEVVFGDVRLPMPTGPWRGLGAAPNTYAVECAMDELARAADTDPIEFRVRHSKDQRLADVLTRLQTKLGSDAHQYGIAATAYKGVTFVAVAAKVERVNEMVRVTHLVCTHDCGRVVAPDRVLAQIEGNLVWGVSMALDERFELSNGIARTDNFDTYPIARNSDVPDMDIEMIDSELNPSGAGEAALAPAAAAIANGLFASTGERHRALPIRRG